jgi:hypothetical protein
MKYFKVFFIAMLLLFSNSCSTVTIKKSAQTELQREPDYQKSKDYAYNGGLFGEHHFYLHDICPNGVEQIKTQRTFSDEFFTLITLGFYSPYTAKIWCKRDQKQ